MPSLDSKVSTPGWSGNGPAPKTTPRRADAPRGWVAPSPCRAEAPDPAKEGAESGSTRTGPHDRRRRASFLRLRRLLLCSHGGAPILRAVFASVTPVGRKATPFFCSVTVFGRKATEFFRNVTANGRNATAFPVALPRQAVRLRRFSVTLRRKGIRLRDFP
jgi:hypothetical protein